MTPKKIALLAGLLLVLLGGFYFVFMGNKTQAPQTGLEDPKAAEIEKAVESADETNSVILTGDIDLDKAKTERVLGNTTAPIKITEHASLTCSHCATFHKNTMPAFIKNYIDTGKAYLVFSDFPLNAPALHASMAARCAPEDQYFNFIKSLFEDQENWAFDAGYMDILKKKASDFGLNDKKFDACLKSEALQSSLLDRIKAVQGQWSINSTPSFVVNNQIVVSGALTYEDFDKKIQDALAEIAKKEQGSGAVSPAPKAVEGE